MYWQMNTSCCYLIPSIIQIADIKHNLNLECLRYLKLLGLTTSSEVFNIPILYLFIFYNMVEAIIWSFGEIRSTATVNVYIRTNFDCRVSICIIPSRNTVQLLL